MGSRTSHACNHHKASAGVGLKPVKKEVKLVQIFKIGFILDVNFQKGFHAKLERKKFKYPI